MTIERILLISLKLFLRWRDETIVMDVWLVPLVFWLKWDCKVKVKKIYKSRPEKGRSLTCAMVGGEVEFLNRFSSLFKGSVKGTVILGKTFKMDFLPLYKE